MRLSLADAAHSLSDRARGAADVLRDVDREVEAGERNELGIKRKAQDQPEDTDVRAKFEKGMDTAKEAGSKAIGAGQSTAQATQELAQRSSSRIQDAFYQVGVPRILSERTPLTSSDIVDLRSRTERRELP